MKRSKLKEAAKSQMKGKIGILFLIELIIALVSFGVSTVLSLIPFVGPFAVLCVTAAFALSTSRVYLNLTAYETPEVGDAFSGFDDFLAALVLNLLIGLFTYLWTLLFIIPGIVKSYSYSMSMFILAENKGKSALECINESKTMTNGYKMDLFLLDLSFIGWEILNVFTIFILSIWLVPYINATKANAYYFIKPKPANPVMPAPEMLEQAVVVKSDSASEPDPE